MAQSNSKSQNAEKHTLEPTFPTTLVQTSARATNNDRNPMCITKDGSRIRCISPDKSFAGKIGTVKQIVEGWYAWVQFDGFAEWIAIDLTNLIPLSTDVEKPEVDTDAQSVVVELPDPMASSHVEEQETSTPTETQLGLFA